MPQSIEEKKAILAQYNYPYEEFQKLEELRGCPIELWSDKDVVEYEEYCSPELLAKHPLVTVWMLTYNHEKYISEAIEGVVNQQCDFDFELLIVEDHSSDKTLDICKEYQQKYPGIIRLFTPKERRPFVLARVLRSKDNIDKVLRGKYLAFCEGDDYWTDMRKLELEITVLENNRSIGLVSTNYIGKIEEENKYIPNRIKLNEGIYDYDKLDCFPWLPCQTAGIMVRSENYKTALIKEVIFRFVLNCGDIQLFFSNVTAANMQYRSFYVIAKETYVKRDQPCGISYSSKSSNQTAIDGYIASTYYSCKIIDKNDRDDFFLYVYTHTFIYQILSNSYSNIDDKKNIYFRRLNELLESRNKASTTLNTLRHSLLGLYNNPELRNFSLELCQTLEKIRYSIYDDKNKKILRILNHYLPNYICLKIHHLLHNVYNFISMNLFSFRDK